MSDNKSLDSLFKLVHSLKRNMQEQIEELNLGIAPMHIRVLKIISHKPHCTAVDIANFLDRDKAQVTRLLSTLLKEELIVKEANPEDKRSQFLQVTPNGQVIMSKIANVDKVMLEKMENGIEKETMESFQRAVNAMIANLNDK